MKDQKCHTKDVMERKHIQATIDNLFLVLEYLKSRVTGFVIEQNDEIREVIELHYFRCKSWDNVNAEIGSGYCDNYYNTILTRICHRYDVGCTK